jgi:hypothetical protein
VGGFQKGHIQMASLGVMHDDDDGDAKWKNTIEICIPLPLDEY